jgi:hypothetical protein
MDGLTPGALAAFAWRLHAFKVWSRRRRLLPHELGTVSVLLGGGVVGADVEPVALVPDDRDVQALTLVLEGDGLLPGGRWPA